jgi:hypothetical protein
MQMNSSKEWTASTFLGPERPENKAMFNIFDTTAFYFREVVTTKLIFM